MQHVGRTISRGWLITLRLGAAGSKLAITLTVHFALGIELPLLAIGVLLGVEALSNLLLLRESSAPVAQRSVLAVMAFDIALLTVLLHMTGGASNPFSFVYLIYLSLAAASLPVRWSWGLTALTIGCSASLFVAPVDSHHGHHDMLLHLRGMWVAFVVAGAFIVVFVNRLRHELERQQEHLDRVRRLASVTTLAAGAAHELATPLGTIAVAAGELRQAAEDPAFVEDIELIQRQVERCSEILGQLDAEAGAVTGETPRATTVTELLAPLAASHPQLRLDVAERADVRHRLPIRAMRRVLGSLVDNALEASDADAPVTISARRQGDAMRIEVRDRGAGMNDDVLPRAREPFFTTKDDGMGLGLFLASAVAEQLGGSLDVRSTPGAGTQVTIVYPMLHTENPDD